VATLADLVGGLQHRADRVLFPKRDRMLLTNDQLPTRLRDSNLKAEGRLGLVQNVRAACHPTILQPSYRLSLTRFVRRTDWESAASGAADFFDTSITDGADRRLHSLVRQLGSLRGLLSPRYWL
jgi:hypothetical protein